MNAIGWMNAVRTCGTWRTAVFVFGPVLLAVASGCGDTAPRSGTERPPMVYSIELTVNTTADLPKCTAALAGTTAFVVSPANLWSCVANNWVALPCTKALGGALAYATATKVIYACVAGKWTPVDLPAGSQGPAGPPGDAGAPGTLLAIRPEPAGPNCSNGGQRIDVGADDDRDGVLDGDEIDSTNYVCNGIDGARCGNGVLETGEACDDGNAINTDACTSTCALASCGDGITFVGVEECDDANVTPGDGCSATCQTEQTVQPGQCVDPASGQQRWIVKPMTGELVITEVMVDPLAVPDTTGEWFEVLAKATVDLNGLVVASGLGRSTPVNSSTCIPLAAGTRALFAKTRDPVANGGLPEVTALFDISLSNISPGAVALLASDGAVIDEAPYRLSAAGHSMELSWDLTDAVVNDNLATWCPSNSRYGLGDFGTPGAVNQFCP